MRRLAGILVAFLPLWTTLVSAAPTLEPIAKVGVKLQIQPDSSCHDNGRH